MRIAIIGVGNVGTALARACNVVGHTVVVSAKHPAHAAETADEVKVAAAGSNREAAQDADLVVLAIPAKAVASVLDDIRDLVADTVLVDPTNPLDEGREAILRASASLAEAAALLAPRARVVKAFNTILASRLNDPVVDGIALDGFYAGNDAIAKAMVADLLAELGFRPVDTGELLTARALELMAFLNVALNARNGWSWRSGWKLLGSDVT
jgi:8-hydroxy-5-deazaflavin:NADPH oxidoreductase